MVQWGEPALEARLTVIGMRVRFLMLGAYWYVFLLGFQVKIALE